MRDGFVKVAAVTPDIRVADVAYNTQNICKKHCLLRLQKIQTTKICFSICFRSTA